jgi:hypothetical protein
MSAIAAGWDHKQISRFPRLVDQSPEGQRLLRIAQRAYETHYQTASRWEELNPEIRDYWLQIAAAVLAAREQEP